MCVLLSAPDSPPNGWLAGVPLFCVITKLSENLNANRDFGEYHRWFWRTFVVSEKKPPVPTTLFVSEKQPIVPTTTINKQTLAIAASYQLLWNPIIATPELRCGLSTSPETTICSSRKKSTTKEIYYAMALWNHLNVSSTKFDYCGSI